ncbi:glycosyltransferase-like protein [Lacticaseibacillus paracasei subsp. paracasei Lpp228]|uniref:glycosyltransferase family 2 protein n=1 Tax=Lacticaseibacillus paracasei TaxID=1597 RepID=UPI000343E692|nr:glycosyltransferase family A protein [Lacticaseibacillus paracasei]EPC58391.1 glycosyltransferase-like protein [Lacticaseibacillus paracasei subsp. paracasei Lpp189]EPC65160.1 glycosyltransferase-like protein [Lacticaseibacillus paracasei subsp. paracasei Lpp228]RND36579.1 putative glycosyltransferase EpsJ [Lacticaseibacillus paracasei]
MNPVVTVVIPIYNSEKFLPDLLMNLHNQKYQMAEFLLIDDGSTDQSAEIISQYISLSSDRRLHLVQQKNAGVSSARNTGLGLARGEYIIFADSDDLFDSEFVEAYVSRIKLHNSDMEFFSAEKVDGSSNHSVIGAIDYTNIASETPISAAQMITYFSELKAWGFPFCYISRTKLWEEIRFDTAIRYQEDVLVLFQIWTKFPKVTMYVNCESHYQYVQHADSALHTMTVEDYWQFVTVDDRILEMVGETFPAELTVKLEALRTSSLMSVIASSLILKDDANYKKARHAFFESYKRAAFSRDTLKRRVFQFILLKLNTKFLLRVVYRNLYKM